jgi:hypothetical protein
MNFWSSSFGKNKKRTIFTSVWFSQLVKEEAFYLPAFILLHPVKINEKHFYQLCVFFIGLKYKRFFLNELLVFFIR